MSTRPHVTKQALTAQLGAKPAGTGHSRRPTVAAQEAWDLLSSFMFSGYVHQLMHDACGAVDLAPGLAKALLSLEPGVARPMGELAGSWRCDASYATSIADALEGRGLVERQILPTDRRVRTVQLTAAGEAARQRWLHAIADPPPGFASLSAPDARALRDLLEQVLPAAEGAGMSDTA